ncbi:MAG TPA: NTPase [Dehalococcoidia bacterium]|nr:NTPase [Dehalococcoidia bacterium]
MANVYLLTGSPGAGKTTVIREAIARTKAKAGGFCTEEIRSGGIRQGFRITTLDGRNAILAHIDIFSHHRVSKYGVDTRNLDEVGVAALHRAIEESDLIVIDEIGKMELFSPRFKEAVLKAIDSGKKALGTIMLTPHPFADEIKYHPKVKVVQVSRANHDQVLREVISWLKLTADENKPQNNRQHR